VARGETRTRYCDCISLNFARALTCSRGAACTWEGVRVRPRINSECEQQWGAAWPTACKQVGRAAATSRGGGYGSERGGRAGGGGAPLPITSRSLFPCICCHGCGCGHPIGPSCTQSTRCAVSEKGAGGGGGARAPAHSRQEQWIHTLPHCHDEESWCCSNITRVQAPRATLPSGTSPRPSVCVGGGGGGGGPAHAQRTSSNPCPSSRDGTLPGRHSPHTSGYTHSCSKPGEV
jgi:hypothetical protein